MITRIRHKPHTCVCVRVRSNVGCTISMKFYDFDTAHDTQMSHTVRLHAPSRHFGRELFTYTQTQAGRNLEVSVIFE